MEWTQRETNKDILSGHAVKVGGDEYYFWMFVSANLIKKYGEELAYFVTLLQIYENTARTSPMPEEEKLTLPPKPSWGIIDKTKTHYVWIPWRQMQIELSAHIPSQRMEPLLKEADRKRLIIIHPNSDIDRGEVYVKSTDV
jgi:hypothetical protein